MMYTARRGSKPLRADLRDFMTDARKQYYVYIYRDPRPDKGLEPIYVGKGDPDRRRAQIHWRRGSHNRILNRILAKLRGEGLEPVIELAGMFDDEAAAHDCERELIAKYGRRHLGTGPLCNITEGGEGVSGLRHTPEARAKMRAAKATPDARRRSSEAMARLNQDPDFTKARLEAQGARASSCARAMKDPSFRAAQSARMKQALADDADLMAARVKQIQALSADPEMRAVYSETTKAAWQDPEKRDRRIAGLTRAANDPALIEKRRQQMKARWADPEAKAKHAEACRAARLRYLAR